MFFIASCKSDNLTPQEQAYFDRFDKKFMCYAKDDAKTSSACKNFSREEIFKKISKALVTSPITKHLSADKTRPRDCDRFENHIRIELTVGNMQEGKYTYKPSIDCASGEVTIEPSEAAIE